MASSSSHTVNTTAKPSRFSTLKVFKLSRDKDGLKPPPLPPKDPYYLNRNRSLASLSPESLSLPTTPLSPPYQYASNSPNPNKSSMSLASSSTSVSPADPSTRKKDKTSKSSSFFKFSKRSPSSPSLSMKSPALDDGQLKSPASVDDDNISLPWNFQHHIHVDEAYGGLPPSWISSLMEAGLSEDEIYAIQTRRAAGARSPGLQNLQNDRPQSPSAPNSNQINGAAPVLTRPTPRTTSLPRQFSETPAQGQTPPRHPTAATGLSPSLSYQPLRTNDSPNTTTRIRKFSVDSTRHGSSSSISLSISAGSDLSLHRNATLEPTITNGTAPPLRSSSPARVEPDVVATPPRRKFHVANGEPTSSPPPAYTNSSPHGYPQEKDRSLFTSRSESNVTTNPPFSVTPADVQRPRASTDVAHNRTNTASSLSSGSSSTSEASSSQSQNSTQRKRRSKRFTTLPPRLSLYKDDSVDLSSWSESLFSAIPSPGTNQDNIRSTFGGPPEQYGHGSEHLLGEGETGTTDPLTSTSQMPTARPSPPHGTQAPSSITTRRPPPPTRPVPNIGSVEDRHRDDDEMSPSWAEPPTGNTSDDLSTAGLLSAAWNELAGMVKAEGSPDVFTPALNETYSPTLPITPARDKDKDPRFTIAAYGRRWSSVDGDERDDTGDETRLSYLSVESAATERDPNRDSDASVSSVSTVSTVTASGLTVVSSATIVRNASVARRAVANVIDKSKSGREQEKERMFKALPPSPQRELVTSDEVKHPGSPQSSNGGSEYGSGSGSAGSGSSSPQSLDHQTEETEMDSPRTHISDHSPKPSQTKLSVSSRHQLLPHGGVLEEVQKKDAEENEEDEESEQGSGNVASTDMDNDMLHKPQIVITEPTLQVEPGPLTSMSTGMSPMTPSQRYRGWVTEVVAPLEEFIDDAIDPREYYVDLQEIAEGESGSVFAARLVETNAHKLKLPPMVKARDHDNISKGEQTLVAIKNVPILPSGSPKLDDLQRELTLMRGMWHENVLGMDALYVDLVDDSLWIRMELMERSLADVIGLVEEGLMLQDRMIARFASDVLLALEYLQKQHIAHRDVRSDNLLVNRRGILKLTDFSNAVQVTPMMPLRSDPVGVIYWQAPEVRSGLYNVLKVDAWSLGATVWEMAQAEPPFSDIQQIGDRWPPLSKPELHSPAFHDFLQLCSEPSTTRLSPTELTKSSFIQNACGRPVIIQLLSQCVAIERMLQERESMQQQ